jgi:hypothetical protein
LVRHERSEPSAAVPAVGLLARRDMFTSVDKLTVLP